ncbi:MAG: sugar transferase, partial [Candidatus Omnitrophica bacterium]|nr:sugar transferase [Candidatus Omnitrophota bacterium]
LESRAAPPAGTVSHLVLYPQEIPYGHTRLVVQESIKNLFSSIASQESKPQLEPNPEMASSSISLTSSVGPLTAGDGLSFVIKSELYSKRRGLGADEKDDDGSSPVRSSISRAVGRLTAGVLLPLLLIPIGGIAFFIWLSSGAPITFIQERLGYKGRKIKVWKFRTLTNEADPSQRRLTGMGRIMRPLGIDELLQIFNIIKGDMVWFGPRPRMASEIQTMSPDPDEYLTEVVNKYRPGIFGWIEVTEKTAEVLELLAESKIPFVSSWGRIQSLRIWGFILTKEWSRRDTAVLDLIKQRPNLKRHPKIQSLHAGKIIPDDHQSSSSSILRWIVLAALSLLPNDSFGENVEQNQQAAGQESPGQHFVDSQKLVLLSLPSDPNHLVKQLLLRAAREEKILLGSSDWISEAGVRQSQGLSEHAFIFGLEDDFVRRFNMLLVDYGRLYRYFLPKYLKPTVYRGGKTLSDVYASLLDGVIHNLEFQQYWLRMGQLPRSPRTQELYATLDELIHDNDQEKISTFLSQERGSDDVIDLLNIHRLLFDLILKDFDKTMPMPTALAQVRAYLNNPRNLELKQYVHEEFSRIIQENFIAKNIMSVLRTVLARNLPLYVVVTPDQMENLELVFSKLLENGRFQAYKDIKDIPLSELPDAKTLEHGIKDFEEKFKALQERTIKETPASPEQLSPSRSGGDTSSPIKDRIYRLKSTDLDVSVSTLGAMVIRMTWRGRDLIKPVTDDDLVEYLKGMVPAKGIPILAPFAGPSGNAVDISNQNYLGQTKRAHLNFGRGVRRIELSGWEQWPWGKDPMHGFLWSVPWKVSQFWQGQQSAAVRLIFDSRRFTDRAHPHYHNIKSWGDFRYEVGYNLKRHSLAVNFSFINFNREKTPMVFSLHPFFEFETEHQVREAKLQVPALRIFTNKNQPTGETRSVEGTDFDLRILQSLGRNEFDNVQTDLQRSGNDMATARLVLGHVGAGVNVSVDRSIPHLVVFALPFAKTISIEPHTGLPNAFELLKHNHKMHNHLYKTGQGKNGRIVFEVRPLRSSSSPLEPNARDGSQAQSALSNDELRELFTRVWTLLKGRSAEILNFDNEEEQVSFMRDFIELAIATPAIVAEPESVRELVQRVDQTIEELKDLSVNVNVLYFDSLVESQLGPLAAILRDGHELRRFLALLSKIREIIEYEKVYVSMLFRRGRFDSQTSSREESIIYKGIRVDAGSASFRRFVIDNQYEIKIPGELEDRDWIAETHWTIAKKLWRPGVPMAQPLGIVEAEGQFSLYNEVKNFTQAAYPLRAVVFQNLNGMRLEYFMRSDDIIYATAQKLEISVEQLRVQIVGQLIRIAIWVLQNGFIGHDQDANDWHLENFAVNLDGNLILVTDFGAYQYVSRHISVSRIVNEVQYLLMMVKKDGKWASAAEYFDKSFIRRLAVVSIDPTKIWEESRPSEIDAKLIDAFWLIRLIVSDLRKKDNNDTQVYFRIIRNNSLNEVLIFRSLEEDVLGKREVLKIHMADNASIPALFEWMVNEINIANDIKAAIVFAVDSKHPLISAVLDIRHDDKSASSAAKADDQHLNDESDRLPVNFSPIAEFISERIFRGSIVTIDGLGAAGKSIFADQFRQWLRAQGFDAVVISGDDFLLDFNLRNQNMEKVLKAGQPQLDHARIYRWKPMNEYLRSIVEFISSKGDLQELREFTIREAQTRGQPYYGPKTYAVKRGDVVIVEFLYPMRLGLWGEAKIPQLHLRLISDIHNTLRDYKQRSRQKYGQHQAERREQFYKLANIPSWRQYHRQTKHLIDLKLDVTGGWSNAFWKDLADQVSSDSRPVDDKPSPDASSAIALLIALSAVAAGIAIYRIGQWVTQKFEGERHRYWIIVGMFLSVLTILKTDWFFEKPVPSTIEPERAHASLSYEKWLNEAVRWRKAGYEKLAAKAELKGWLVKIAEKEIDELFDGSKQPAEFFETLEKLVRTLIELYGMSVDDLDVLGQLGRVMEDAHDAVLAAQDAKGLSAEDYHMWRDYFKDYFGIVADNLDVPSFDERPLDISPKIANPDLMLNVMGHGQKGSPSQRGSAPVFMSKPLRSKFRTITDVLAALLFVALAMAGWTLLLLARASHEISAYIRQHHSRW